MPTAVRNTVNKNAANAAAAVKSLFGNNTTTTSSGSGISFSTDMSAAVKQVLNFYATPLNKKNWSVIPTDTRTYLSLNQTLATYLKSQTNSDITNIITIVSYCLSGAMNASLLSQTVADYSVKIAFLQNQLDAVNSNVNKKQTMTGESNLTIQKTFHLAPIFNYYIALYGVPEYGVGFDKDKLHLLFNFFQQNNISPY